MKFAPNAAMSYSMDSQSQETTKFVPNSRVAAFQKLSQIEQRNKVSKQIKSEVLNSLTGSITSSMNPIIGLSFENTIKISLKSKFVNFM